jgi:hypothetical protein
MPRDLGIVEPVPTAPSAAPAAAAPPSFTHTLTVAGLLRLPTRMTVLPLGREPSAGVALISPVPLTAPVLEALAPLAPVRAVIAPNLLHHLYFAPAAAHFPDAELYAPAGLAAKRRDLAPLLEGPRAHPLVAAPERLGDGIELLPLAGAPAIAEHLVFHPASRSLVVTDLVFHLLAPEGLWTGLILRAVGCHRRLAASRAWNIAVRDRPAFARSLERALEWPFERLIVAHGEIVEHDARERLRAALARFLRHAPARLPAPAADAAQSNSAP